MCPHPRFGNFRKTTPKTEKNQFPLLKTDMPLVAFTLHREEKNPINGTSKELVERLIFEQKRNRKTIATLKFRYVPGLSYLTNLLNVR